MQNEQGAEIVQFALMAPILIGLVWGSFELWQIMSLRATLRTTTAQAARYITAYAAPPAEIESPLSPDQVCRGVEELIGRSLAAHRGILGDAISWEVSWYLFTDPQNPSWQNNAQQLPDCQTLVSFLRQAECSQRQFGVRLHIAVPWQKVLFGIKGLRPESFSLEMSDTAVGDAPCMPDCAITALAAEASPAGPRGCTVYVYWNIESTYSPWLELYVGDRQIDAGYVLPNPYRLSVSEGAHEITLVAASKESRPRRETSRSITIVCQ